MAKCALCGQDSDWLGRPHEGCRNALEPISRLVSEAAKSGGVAEDLPDQCETLSKRYAVAPASLPVLIAKGWERAVEDALEDHVITEEEETALARLRDLFGLSQELLDRNGAYTKVAQMGVLRELLQGRLPDRMKVDNLPFNFQSGERLVWMFKSVEYFERRTTVKESGGSLGVGVGIGPVYLGGAQFRGRPIPVTETVPMGSGTLVATNRHLWFDGSTETFRIPYPTIVALVPYSDGFGVRTDDAPGGRFFLTQDGWFSYNLAATLIRRPEDPKIGRIARSLLGSMRSNRQKSRKTVS